MGYIKSIRPLACIFPGLLVLASMRLATGNVHQGWLPAIAIFVLFLAIMAQNDLRDRWHDSKKGKTFVLNNTTSFKWFTLMLWLSGIGLASIASDGNPAYLWIFGFVVIGGLIYSEVRSIPMASNCLVALITGSSALFPLSVEHQSILPSVWLFSAITSSIIAREILKDFNDQHIDSGYKWTFIQRFGEARSMMIVKSCLVLSSIVLLLVNLAVLPLVLLLMPFRPSLLEIEAAREEDNYSAKKIANIKLFMDIGLAAIMMLYIFSFRIDIPPIFADATAMFGCLIAAYLIGSIPFSWLTVWFLGPRDEQGNRTDLRLLGSGNVGATNAMLQLNRRVWYPVLILLDASKAIASILILGRFFPGTTDPSLILGLAATSGHCFPVFLGYERGRGIACTLGVLVLCLPTILPILLGICLAVVLLLKKIQFKLDQRIWIASVISAAAMPIFAWILTRNDMVTSFLVIQAILVIFCHRDHYERILEPMFNKLPEFNAISFGLWLMDLIWKPKKSM